MFKRYIQTEIGEFSIQSPESYCVFRGKISTSSYNKIQETSTQIPLLVLKKDQVCVEKACFRKQI